MPLPDDRHAVSVCLPTWDSVLGYEEGRDKVVSKLRCGYPRFFKHPAVERLFKKAQEELGMESERVVVFPHKDAAQRAQRFVEKRTNAAARVAGFYGLQALLVPESAYDIAMEFWRYTGEIVSSRQALDVLDGDGIWKYDVSDLRERIAGYGNYEPEDVFLYESGMSCIFAVHRALCNLAPNTKSLQLDFPYVDVLKVQNNFGAGAVFLHSATGELFDEALQRIRTGDFCAVYCEVPSNPLLRTVDLEKVSKACREGGVPLVVDDTVCSVYNVEAARFADVITTSLTKWISGKGDVMAGGVQLVKSSPFYGDLKAFFDEDCVDGSRLYAADAAVLDENSKGFLERIANVNESAEAIVEFLMQNESVESVWYPRLSTKDEFDKLKREGRGYGGLISFCLSNDKKAPKLFDALEISKGPSLGTEFSLACPYTLLAHYDELDWAAGCGVPENLIRISVGNEGKEELLKRFQSAFDQI